MLEQLPKQRIMGEEYDGSIEETENQSVLYLEM